MNIQVYGTAREMAKAAAAAAADELSNRINERGHAAFMAATGRSQIEFLDFLVRRQEIDWSKTTMFHLDEYIGLPESHPASFRRYLRERLIDLVHPGRVHLINGNNGAPEAECARLTALVKEEDVDVAFVGIGENAHLAFNDPPADFDTKESFVVATLSETCRAQQVHEGWFAAVPEVPRKAITVTVHQILEARSIVCVVPGERKAEAVKCGLVGPVSSACPASILRHHSNCRLFLDAESSALVDHEFLQAESQPTSGMGRKDSHGGTNR